MIILVLTMLLNTQTAEAHAPRRHHRTHAHHHRVNKPKAIQHSHWVWVRGHWEIRAHRRVWIRGYWELRPVHHYHPPRR